jgi:hypothetical protein
MVLVFGQHGVLSAGAQGLTVPAIIYLLYEVSEFGDSNEHLSYFDIKCELSVLFESNLKSNYRLVFMPRNTFKRNAYCIIPSGVPL